MWFTVQSVNHTEAEVVGAGVIFASSADDRWSVLEEDMLLDAVEHHGFGSWLVWYSEIRHCSAVLITVGS